MSKKGSKISRYLKAPLKLLMKAKDFYIKSMTEYSDRISYRSVMGCPTPQLISTPPRSYSLDSTRDCTDNNLKQLIRAASTGSLGNKVQFDNLIERQQARQSPRTRNHYVGIGRIDEDMPCEFVEDGFKVKTNVSPRGRSFAVTKSKGALNL